MRKLILAAFAATLLATPAAMAQNNNKIDAGGGKGLVVVDVNGIDVNLLNDLTITDNTVQVPITVAAVLCELEVNVIASSNDKGNKSCEATDVGAQNFADSM